MKTQTIIYLAVLVLCVVISGVILALYYSQEFSENFSFKEKLRLADVVFVARDQNDYDINYNCSYDEFEMYVCDQPQNTNYTKYLQSATANVGLLELSNEGFFTHIYQPPRLLGCIEFVTYATSNGLQFPREISIEYLKAGSSNTLGNKNYYDYNYESLRLEIKPGKKNTYDLIANYAPYNVPLADFTRANMKKIVVYKIPTKQENPLSDDYGYNSFYYNPTCEYAEEQNIKQEATILIA